MSAKGWVSALLAAFAFAGCVRWGESDEQEEYPAVLAEGTYRVVFGRGYEQADEARFLAVTAQLDRAAGEITFMLSDGSHQTLSFTPRPESEWPVDCVTMKDQARDEIADLAPAPLVIETLTFTTPVVYAKCCSNWMVVANGFGEQETFLRLDLQ